MASTDDSNTHNGEQHAPNVEKLDLGAREQLVHETTQPSPPTNAPDPRPQTPPDQVDVPEPGPDGVHDLSRPEYFLNRELSWLNFNFRVLHEAEDSRTPLLERIKFISIVGSNLDEFFMKRIGGLKQQVGAEIHELTIDGRTPQLQIDECCDLVHELEQRQRKLLLRLIGELKQHDVWLTTWEALSDDQRTLLRNEYVENIYPLVTPQAIDPAHPFPFISNLSLNLLVGLRYPGSEMPSLARVKVPIGVGIPRLLKLPGEQTYVRMETVIAHNLDLLFPDMEIESCAMFRVTRNANTERSEEKAEDLLAMIETELRDRKFAPIVRLEVATSMNEQHRGMLAAELGLNEQADVFEVEGMLGMRDLMELMQLKGLDRFHGTDFQDPPHHPVDHPDLTSTRSIFHIIREAGPILLHHPYTSFSTSVERLLSEASRDPKVRAIKMTLYRTSADTKALGYLIDAAENGKQVAVVVELKARFDERANIRWANRLEAAGIHVTYGVVGLKTHCKVILVVRQDHDGLRRYAHVGTGNYHAGTARLYSDLGLLTCDKAIGKDLTELFNYLTTGYKPKRNYRAVLTAPKTLKKSLLAMIEREVSQHTEDDPGRIVLKVNAIEDADVTRALYEAARFGVQVDLIVRDTCRLRPGILGLSENVRVISVVGRFLEHTRILYFKNGGSEEFYIGSADCMKRNLESRVELFTPIQDPSNQKELSALLSTQLADVRSAWDMQANGRYVQRTPDNEEEPRSSQEQLIHRAEKRFHAASRLKRRKPRGPRRRGR